MSILGKDFYCTACCKYKFATDFAMHRTKTTGRQTWCKECTALYRKNNRSKIRDEHKRWRDANRTALNNKMRDTEARRKGIKFEGNLNDWYDQQLALQGGRCALPDCGRLVTAERHGRLRIDHDHTTLKVRELLCDDCNKRVGFFEKDRSRHEVFAAYLARHGR